MSKVKRARVVRMLFCDFCGASHETRDLLIRGRDDVHICEACVDTCVELVAENLAKPVVEEATEEPISPDQK